MRLRSTRYRKKYSVQEKIEAQIATQANSDPESITFNEDGSHTNSQGNFMSTYDCTGTWEVNGNRLTLVNDCGRKKQDLNMHFSIEDSILSWVYEFSDNGEKFKRK